MLLRKPVRQMSSNSRCYALSVREVNFLELATQLHSQNVNMIILFSHLASQGSALANTLLPVLLLRYQTSQTTILTTLLTDEVAVSFNRTFSTISLSQMAPEIVHQRTGFYTEEVQQLMILYGGESTVSVQGRTMPLDLVILVALERLRNGSDLSTYVTNYGGEARRWGEAVTWFIDATYLYASRLEGPDAMHRYADQAEDFRLAVVGVLQSRGFYPVDGEDTVFGFIDATNFRCCNPGDSQTQTAVYSGYLKGCAVKALTGVLPNGLSMFVHISSGRNPDNVEVTNCGLEASLKEYIRLSGVLGRIYSVYGDKIFGPTGLVKAPNDMENPRNSTATFRLANPNFVDRCNSQDLAMSFCRASIEHQYGNVKNSMRYYERTSKHKLLANDNFRKLIPIAFFFHDVKACFRGNDVSKMFSCEPPTFKDYMRTLMS